MEQTGHYDYFLVALSVAIAILASFTALNLAGRLLAAEGANRLWWLAAAAVALGGGIWSMHFVGMLAFIMPMPMSYDVDLTVLSLLVAIAVVGIGLAIPGRSGPKGLRLAPSPASSSASASQACIIAAPLWYGIIWCGREFRADWHEPHPATL